MNDDRQPWERQLEDTAKSWAAFCIYRDLGPERSIDKAHKIYVRQSGSKTPASQRAPRWWWKWSKELYWVARVAAYDEYVDVLNRAAFEKERLKARAERRQLIRAAKAKLAKMLNNLKTNNPKSGEVVHMMRLVLQEERAEYNDEPTQRVEHSGPAGQPIQFNLIDEALRKIYGERDQENNQGDS